MNWRRLAAGAVGVALAQCVLAFEPLESVVQLQWSNRVIVVNAEDTGAEAVSLLASAARDIDDRHIVWFVVDGDRLDSNYPGEISPRFADRVRVRLQLMPGESVLVGKDGGVKSRSSSLEMAVLFALIDTMPMRQREMREQRVGSD